MSKKHVLVTLLILVTAVAGCTPTATPTATPPPTAIPEPTVPPSPTLEPTPEPTQTVAKTGIVISEVLTGIFGLNNNLEFIELYNVGTEAADLDGWSLWYRLNDKKKEVPVYAWHGRADIPGHGHYLLTRAGQDVGNTGDVEYSVSLFEKRGGLALRDHDGQTVDTLVWGEGPTSYLSGSPVPVPEAGASLERLPGGDAGNGIDTGNNAADFTANPKPNPQNSGDPITPLPKQRLIIHLDAPSSVEPGSEIAYTVSVQNATGRVAQNVHVSVPVSDGFEVISIPAGGSQADGRVEWTIPELAAGASAKDVLTLRSPWTYLTTLIQGYYAETSEPGSRVYGPLTSLAVEGGAIPIKTARTLKGKTVTIEGSATMYTGGFYAGSSGTKFYLEDDTGGIQVYCPGGMDVVKVKIGDRVRVTGGIEVYRDSLEIVPATYPDDVTIIEQGGNELKPQPVALSILKSDDSLSGRLVVAEGTATRVSESSYSYEVDLTDDEGTSVLVYIEKETGIIIDPVEVDRRYRVTGIDELYSGLRQLKPRLQADLAEVFPPELILEMHAPLNILPGQTFTYTLDVHNYTAQPLTDVRVVANQPDAGAFITKVLDDGQREGATAIWQIPELAAGKGATVRYVATVGDEASDRFTIQPAVASAAEWSQPVQTSPMTIFVGSSVPIWAIQGDGMTSPYARMRATVEGVVTGVFPDLSGFWFQAKPGDDNPTTSDGLFVLTGDLKMPVTTGDEVRVTGKVREISGQTTLQIAAADDVTVLSSGNALPDAIEFDPPQDKDEAVSYDEALEGMLVKISQPTVAVAPTSKYGETVLVSDHWGVNRVMRGDPTGMLIFVDDGSSAAHSDLSTLPFAIQTGDTVTDITGPLAFTYENYKIEPIASPIITPTERPLPTLEPVGPGEFSIATFNVENLFDYLDPNPADPPKPTRSQYELDLAKTAAAIQDMGAPTIVGMQEVENIKVLKDLAQQDAIAEYNYQPVLEEGTDPRGIDVGYLVRGDQATINGWANYPAPEGLTSRPPLMITVTLHLQSKEATVYAINNHFSSMAGGEKATEPRRTAQAAWNVTLVKRILAAHPDAYVAVMGDMNSFYDSPPLAKLRQSGLRHVYEFTAPTRPYSYIYQGESETLDHILLTPALYDHLARVQVLHIDADYPPPIPGDSSARRVSDHDPVVAVFALP